MDSLSVHLLALEERLLQSAVRADAAALDGLLADEFREFGSSGRAYTRDEIVAALAAKSPCKITLRDFVCERVSPEAALVTYRSCSESSVALRSSLWVYRDERWRMLFHQGTKVPAAYELDAVS